MNTYFSNAVLTVFGLLSLAIAYRAFAAPEVFAGKLGYQLIGSSGLNEVRAQYGGFFAAIALACALSLWGVLPRSTGLVVLALVFGGILFGRLVSLGLDGGMASYSPVIRLLFVVDAIGLAAALGALSVGRGTA